MSTLSIPLSQELPWYTFTTTLTEVTYNLEVRYNTRKDRWTISLFDATEQPIVVGIPMLIGRDLLAPYRSYPVPEGYLFVLDDSGQQTEPTAASFLTDHTLCYVDGL